jgi:hypothetical protein
MNSDKSVSDDAEIAGIEVDYDDPGDGVNERQPLTGWKRALQVFLGVTLVVVGIPMIPLAGPGWAVVLVGLNLIKPDNALSRWIRKQLSRLGIVPEEGAVPKRYFVIGGLLLLVSSVLSIVYGAQVLAWARGLVGW